MKRSRILRAPPILVASSTTSLSSAPRDPLCTSLPMSTPSALCFSRCSLPLSDPHQRPQTQTFPSRPDDRNLPCRAHCVQIFTFCYLYISFSAAAAKIKQQQSRRAVTRAAREKLTPVRACHTKALSLRSDAHDDDEGGGGAGGAVVVQVQVVIQSQSGPSGGTLREQNELQKESRKLSRWKFFCCSLVPNLDYKHEVAFVLGPCPDLDRRLRPRPRTRKCPEESCPQEESPPWFAFEEGFFGGGLGCGEEGEADKDQDEEEEATTGQQAATSAATTTTTTTKRARFCQGES